MLGVLITCTALSGLYGLGTFAAHRVAIRKAREVYRDPAFRSARFFSGAAKQEPWTYAPPSDLPRLNISVTEPSIASNAVFEPSRRSSDIIGVVAAATDGALSAALAHMGARAVADGALHQTIERIGADFDLVASLKEGAASHISAASQAGYLNWLEGHLGETIAQHALAAAGHTVCFASTINQSGWDLIVDGHLYNVKVGVSAAQHVAEHLSRYPDIGVITDAKTAALFHSDSVMGLKELSIDHLHGAIAGHTHGVEAMHHAHSLNFPYLTLAFSVGHEISIACNHGFNAGEAAVAVVATTAAVAAGAKVGLLAGLSVAGPVGGFIGAVGGAIAGRFVVQAKHTHDAEVELEQFRKDWTSFQSSWKKACSSLEEESKEVTDRWTQVLTDQTASIRRGLERKTEAMAKELDGVCYRYGCALLLALDAIDATLDRDEQEVLARYPRRSPWQRALWPKASDHIGDCALHWIGQKHREIASWQAKLSEATAAFDLGQNAPELRSVIMDMIRRLDLTEDEAGAAGATATAEARALTLSMQEVWNVAVREAMPFRRECERQAGEELSVSWVRRPEEMEAILTPLEERHRTVQRKAERAKMSANPNLLDSHRELVARLKKAVKSMNGSSAPTEGVATRSTSLHPDNAVPG